MRRSLGNKYGFRFWCWNAPFLPMIAPFLSVIVPSLPVQNFHCAVFVELCDVFYIAPFLWTCALFCCRLGMRQNFWIHESLSIHIQYHIHMIYIYVYIYTYYIYIYAYVKHDSNCHLRDHLPMFKVEDLSRARKTTSIQSHKT